jgi:hypothetical protein
LKTIILVVRLRKKDTDLGEINDILGRRSLEIIDAIQRELEKI